MHKDTSASPSAMQQARHNHLDALMADLSVLDERLNAAIESLRVQLGEGADTSQRGLIIEEGDVAGWLQQLGSAGSGPGGDEKTSPAGIGQKEGRLATLGNLFGLGGLERAMLLTALAPEIDLTYGNLYAYVQDDVTKKNPTLDLVATLWCRDLAQKLAARRLLSSGSTLRRHLLMSLDDSPTIASPLLTRPLLLDPRTASYLLGADDPDPALGGAVSVSRPDGNTLSPLPQAQMRSLEELARPIMRRNGRKEASKGGNGAHPPTERMVVWMRGPEGMGKRHAAAQLAAGLGSPLLSVDTHALVASGNDLRKMIARTLREARLQGAVVFWADAVALTLRDGKEGASQELPAELVNALAEWPGCAIFDIRGVQPVHIPATLSVELDFPAPSNERRRMLWEVALNGGAQISEDVDLTLLTGAFKLTGDQIAAAADSARHSASWRAISSGDRGPSQVTMRDLLTACRAHSNQGLGMLARKVTPVYTWADLVLPNDRLSQLHEMCLHIKHGPLVFEEWGFDQKLARGKGLNVLFAGQPGTGKTMAAEVLATDLGLEIYKIDLSSVVSKFIGETEKNLEKIFREGQTSNAILFFDEADSLFGKRSEVKDSHDRYANLETSYLLQRMEEYDGIVILATNLRKNLDDAFIRRMHGAIEFPMPEEPDRLEIWRRTFPIQAPVSEDVDLQFLAKRFKLSGGNIKNIVLEAAFFAAEAGTHITMAHLVKALRREHQKIGRLLHESDFGQYLHMAKGEAATP